MEECEGENGGGVEQDDGDGIRPEAWGPALQIFRLGPTAGRTHTLWGVETLVPSGLTSLIVLTTLPVLYTHSAG